MKKKVPRTPKEKLPRWVEKELRKKPIYSLRHCPQWWKEHVSWCGNHAVVYVGKKESRWLFKRIAPTTDRFKKFVCV